MSARWLNRASLKRWRANPSTFVEDVLHNPEDGKPYELLPAERAFLDHGFKTGADGRLLYPEQVYSCPKKSGKTAFAAMHCLTTALLFGGAFPEVTLAANDYDQAQGRVFEAVKRIVERSPVLAAEAKVTSDRISFPDIGATITAIAADYAGAAGGNPTISCFDELWAYTSERSRRLWDELVPPPTRLPADGDLCRLRRREHAARGALQARPRSAAGRARSVRRRRSADVLEPRADRALADVGVACADAPAAAVERLSAHDRKPVRLDRVLVR
jgi:hypothetical protein